MLLLNPLRGTKADNQALFAQADTPAMFLDGMRGIEARAPMNHWSILSYA